MQFRDTLNNSVRVCLPAQNSTRTTTANEFTLQRFLNTAGMVVRPASSRKPELNFSDNAQNLFK